MLPISINFFFMTFAHLANRRPVISRIVPNIAMAIKHTKFVIPAKAGISSMPGQGVQEDPGFRDCVIIAESDSSGPCHSGLDPESLKITCRESIGCRVRSGMTDKTECLNKLRHSLFRRDDRFVGLLGRRPIITNGSLRGLPITLLAPSGRTIEDGRVMA